MSGLSIIEGDPRQSLLGLPKAKLAEVLTPYVDRSFRIDQIYRALYERQVTDFDAITGLPASLRGELAARFTIAPPELVEAHESADGTVKLLLRLDDGATIEAVDIPDGDRRTLCVSSQAGCALACRFCVTGYWGAGRNLTAGEIVAQVQAVQRRPRDDSHGLNLVFMGMGEPLLNVDHLRDALEILLEQIAWRRVTLSTAGIVPGIDIMATWERRPQLAISLHGAEDDLRTRIMPINQKYPLADLMATLRRYPLRPKERITFEYILIRGLNTADSDADALARLIDGLPAKVNLIPLNPDPVLGDLQPPGRRRIDAFKARLERRGVTVTVRRRRGDDVSAACGQLRAAHREPRGFRRSNLSL